MSEDRAKLYLLPTPLSDAPRSMSIPSGVSAAIHHVRHFICEDPKTARRYLKGSELRTPLEALTFYPLHKHSDPSEVPHYLDPCLEGADMVLLSDAGAPAVADPGGRIVAMAHEKGVRVRPLVGPNAPLMALMASGMNGQRFRFHGYAPHGTPALKKLIGKMKKDAMGGESQIIMETPYRNDRLFQAFLQHKTPSLYLSIAMDLTGEEETVRTLPLTDWDTGMLNMHKRPAIFILGCPPDN